MFRFLDQKNKKISTSCARADMYLTQKVEYTHAPEIKKQQEVNRRNIQRLLQMESYAAIKNNAKVAGDHGKSKKKVRKRRRTISFHDSAFRKDSEPVVLLPDRLERRRISTQRWVTEHIPGPKFSKVQFKSDPDKKVSILIKHQMVEMDLIFSDCVRTYQFFKCLG